MQVEPLESLRGKSMPQQQGDSNASLLAIVPQQVAYTLADFELHEDEENELGGGDNSQEIEGGRVHDGDLQGGERSQAQQQQDRARGPAQPSSSNDVHKVMPDFRLPSYQHKRNDDNRHHFQERTTTTTTAATPTSQAAAQHQHDEPNRLSVLSADIAIWNIVQLLRPSSVMDKQIYMSVGALVLSLVLGTCALCFRDEIFDVTHVNAGLILGSVGTLVMCSIIIGTYLTTKWYRRHMHILLVNLATFDLLLALSFVLEPAWKSVGAGVGDGYTCRWVRWCYCGDIVVLSWLMPRLTLYCVYLFAISCRLCANT